MFYEHKWDSLKFFPLSSERWGAAPCSFKRMLSCLGPSPKQAEAECVSLTHSVTIQCRRGTSGQSVCSNKQVAYDCSCNGVIIVGNLKVVSAAGILRATDFSRRINVTDSAMSCNILLFTKFQTRLKVLQFLLVFYSAWQAVILVFLKYCNIFL